jgi:hypothetical protein
MNRIVVVAAAALLLLSVPAWARHDGAAPAATAAATASPFLPRPPYAGPRQIVFYGHVRSLKRKGVRYELRVDPALWLGGVTASRAALQDTGSPVVANDYYIVDEGHRLLTYVVPPGAHVTVITNAPGVGIRATQVSVAELSQLLSSRNPRKRVLFEPKAGFWIRAATDTVRALDQQYQP